MSQSSVSPSALSSSSQSHPVLPLRDIVVFPHMIVPLFVGRPKSVAALREAMRSDKQVLLLTQRDSALDDPGPDDIHAVGCIATVLQLLDLPDGTVKVLVEGAQRAAIARASWSPRPSPRSSRTSKT